MLEVGKDVMTGQDRKAEHEKRLKELNLSVLNKELLKWFGIQYE